MARLAARLRGQEAADDADDGDDDQRKCGRSKGQRDKEDDRRQPHRRGEDRQPQQRRALQLLEEIECLHLAKRPWAVLSQGERQRVLIGRALMGKPAFVLLDEPAAGMSAAEAQDLSALIRRIAGEMGCGVLLIEHNVGLVLDLCHHIVVLDSGAVIETGDPTAIRASERVRHAYMGTAADTHLPVLEVSA